MVPRPARRGRRRRRIWRGSRSRSARRGSGRRRLGAPGGDSRLGFPVVDGLLADGPRRQAVDVDAGAGPVPAAGTTRSTRAGDFLLPHGRCCSGSRAGARTRSRPVSLLARCTRRSCSTTGRATARSVATSRRRGRRSSRCHRTQTKNTMKLFPALIPERRAAHYGIQIGKQNVWSDGDRRQIEAVTNSVLAIEGGRPHQIIRAEIQNWVQGNGGHEMVEAHRGQRGEGRGRRPGPHPRHLQRLPPGPRLGGRAGPPELRRGRGRPRGGRRTSSTSASCGTRSRPRRTRR